MKRINDLEQNSQCSFWLRAEQGTLVCFPTQVGHFTSSARFYCTVPIRGSRQLTIQYGPSLQTKWSWCEADHLPKKVKG